jgi:hypothetical protein
MEERGGRSDRGLEVLGETPVAVDPGEEALDHPAPRQDLEAHLIGQLADDLHHDGSGVCDLLARIGAVANTFLMKGKRACDAVSTDGAPSRSRTEAGCTCTSRPRPSVSTSA